MFILDSTVCWSASDLAGAAQCEFAVLRTLDCCLGRAERPAAAADPLQEHIARLGDAHEAQILNERRAAGSIVELAHVPRPLTRERLLAAREATLAAFRAEPDVVYQPAFFDGEFFGYADFVERTESGWLVCDAKLARQAKPTAMLQLAAYASQIAALGLPMAPEVSLLLGSGDRADFPAADILSLFGDRRQRLRTLLAEHRAHDSPVVWGDDAVLACGRCDECEHAATEADDVLIVAGVRVEQRRRLREAGISTVADLASAEPDRRPARMAPATFDNLVLQASLQHQGSVAADAAVPAFCLTADAPDVLARMPAPSAGDLFFDFEGDPLYSESDPTRVGLEYLWGFMAADQTYRVLWAHDRAEERAAFIEFVDFVTSRRREFPAMHVYHYAPYETTALKRLAMRFQAREDELDDLLRGEVFVDLYAVVRGAIRAATRSYSIKKLEPLYMGEQLRDGGDEAVGDGGASVVAYHEYRAWRANEPARAAQRLAALENYNTYDCLSTLRLRDWLLARADDAGVRDQIVERGDPSPSTPIDGASPGTTDICDDRHARTAAALVAKSGPDQRHARTPEQQAYAMLANSLDYFRRESKQFWWEHFDRLHQPLDEWVTTRDVFLVESAAVVTDWQVPEGRARNARRQVRLVGDWTPGSTPTAQANVVYAARSLPATATGELRWPPGANGPDTARYGTRKASEVANDPDCPDDARVLLLTESCSIDDCYDDLPVALAPAAPPRTDVIESAIAELAEAAASAEALPQRPGFDILACRPPRMRDGGPLPVPRKPDQTIETAVFAVLGTDNSYVAIQGPPGTGKTYTGARVITELVQHHHWRIGVVAQSHAVVENMLDAIIDAGLDPALVGKSKPSDPSAPKWTVLADVGKCRAAFLQDHAETGCVLGGTAWTFAAAASVPRGALDLLVIDEAGQFSLAPMLGASVAAERLLLLGDPQQLPQVSQGTHAEPVDTSAMGWLMADQPAIPPALGYFLGESYRMHPDLCAKVSELSYAGRLRAAAPARERRLEGVPPGLEVVLLDHVGNRADSPEEAAEVLRQVRWHLGMPWSDAAHAPPRPLAESDVLVVAPYNAQVNLIRRRLDDAGLTGVRVGTVDKFQGQEAPLTVISLVASSHGDVPRGMGFLLNRNRINVAISRAQWKTVVVRSSALTTTCLPHPRGCWNSARSSAWLNRREPPQRGHRGRGLASGGQRLHDGSCRLSDGVDRGHEFGPRHPRGRGDARDLPNVLPGSGLDLSLGRGRLESSQSGDVSAHGSESTDADASRSPRLRIGAQGATLPS